jgi:hypothetical protein
VKAELAEATTRAPPPPGDHRRRGHSKTLELRIEVPVEDMAALGKPVDVPSGPAAQGPVRQSIWTAIHPRCSSWCAPTARR